MTNLVEVVADDRRRVVCARCGAVWAGPYASQAVAERVASNMNADATYRPPAQVRLGAGLCCIPEPAQPWIGEPSPADWASRVVVPRIPRPKGDGDRPAWATGLYGLAALGQLLARTPGIILATLVGPGIVIGALALVGWFVFGAGTAPSAVGVLISITLGVTVLAAIGAGSWFVAWTSSTGKDTSGESIAPNFEPVGHVGDRVKR